MNSSRAGIRLFRFLIFMTGVALASVIVYAGVPAYQTIKIFRGNHPIKIDSTANEGAKPHGMLVLAGDTITWCRDDGGKFSVDFKGKTPFQDGKKHFDETDCTASPDAVIAASGYNDNDVYKYTVTADGKTFDPHVIIAGGGPTQPPIR
jgi:hypothetical protein